MISEHIYAASIGGVSLGTVSGSISLDSTRVPHVQADIEIPLPGHWGSVSVDNPLAPSLVYGAGVYGEFVYGGGGGGISVPVWQAAPEVLATLDPRTSPAPRVTITASSGVSVRSFDLHVRDRSVNHKAGTVSLSLASDEALLTDYAPLSDDPVPFGIAGSLRAVVDYVLGGAVAAALAPGVDADVTAYWGETNYAKNPAARLNAAGYAAGTGTASIGRHTDITWNGLPTIRFSAAGTGEAYLDTPTQASARPRQVWTYSYYLLSSGTPRPARTMIRFKDASGQFVAQYVSPTVTSSGSWTRVSGTAVAPPGTTTVEAFATTTSNATSQPHYTSGHMLTEGSDLPPAARLLPWFDGASTAPGYTTGWDYELDTNASTSTRVPLIERSAESLIWKAGQSAIEFLHPLVQAKGMRLVCDEERRWTLRDETYTAPGALYLRTEVNLTEADESISRDSGVWFDARVTRYRWTDSAGAQQERIDAFALKTPYTRLTTVDLNAAYVGPGRSEYAVRRAQGVGREVTVSTVSDWAARAEQEVSVTMPDAPIQVGLTQSISYDLDTDLMTVTTRTTDTPDGAINLLAGTINALRGVIDGL